ncbi:MAG: hypothetical protein ACRDPC_05535 [Solirubrobacteraceae bacterium]
MSLVRHPYESGDRLADGGRLVLLQMVMPRLWQEERARGSRACAWRRCMSAVARSASSPTTPPTLAGDAGILLRLPSSSGQPAGTPLYEILHNALAEPILDRRLRFEAKRGLAGRLRGTLTRSPAP